jgi:hypothetical protein
MSFEFEPLHASKRKKEDSVREKTFIELTDEELLASFADDAAFCELLRQKQQEAKEKYQENEAVQESAQPPAATPAWKDELQRKLANAQTVEDLDLLTKEIVKKNKTPKKPKKKLMRVENFYQRHIQGLQWMNTFLERTKSTATSRPFVERMLELENEFKIRIENDDLLGPHLEKD